MSDHVLMNLLNELGKRDKMRGLHILLHGVISLPDATSYVKMKLNNMTNRWTFFYNLQLESYITVQIFWHQVS